MTLVVRSVRRASVVTRTTPAPQALYEPQGTTAAHVAAADPHGDRAFATQAIAAAAAGYQPASAQLSALAAVSGAPYGRALLTLPSAAALRDAAELGSAAQASVSAFDPAGAAAAAQAFAVQREHHTGTQPWSTLTATPTSVAGYGITDAVASAMLGVANGVATLDALGKLPLAQIPDSILGQVEFQGLWDAAANLPALPNPPAAGTNGHYYIATTAGTQFGIAYGVGDWLINNGGSWGKVDNTDAVTSVAGRTGAVTLASADLTDGTAAGRALFTAADAPAQRTALGLGTAATSSLNNLVITGGSINGTPIGGTIAAAINGTTIAATTSLSAGTTQLTQGFLRFSTAEPNTYIRRSNNDQIAFVCNNIQNLFLTTGGVGVGLAASNTEFFHIKGDARRAALESYGSTAHLRLLSAGGTTAAPTATANAAVICQVSAAGMRTDASQSDFRTTGYIRWTATQAWTTTACGSRLSLSTAPNNAVDPVDRLHIDQDGAILVNTGTNDGVNRVQVNGSVTVSTGSAYKVNNTQVVGARDTGWAALSGTTDKATAYATYAGTAHGGLYSMTAVQALDDAVRNLSRRYGALETAARNHGLIN